MSGDTRRYSAEEMHESACSIYPDGSPTVDKIKRMLHQAASTEAKVLGLVEGLSALAEKWERKVVSCTESSYDMGCNDAKDRCCDEIREALSTFRGQS